MTHQVPQAFKLPHPFNYPPLNSQCFEEWFYSNYNDSETKSERVYLPIFWTGYQVRANFGKDHVKMELLQYVVDQLPRDTKYFTIVQYDDGILADLKDLDIKVFAMSGNRIDYPLPLIYNLPTVNFNAQKQIFCNFIGRNTHPLRERMLQALPPFRQRSKVYYIRETTHEPNRYFERMAQSTFCLCARGYGITSFRILEAIANGAIPVYVSDQFIFPHNLDFNSYGVVIKENEIEHITEILEAIPKEVIKEKQDRLSDIYYQYFSYEANKRLILENI